MADLWMPGAEHLDIGDHAPLDGGPAKAIAHITWDHNGTKAKPIDLVPFADLKSYFGSNATGRSKAPHILWSPFTGEVCQFVPANSRSKSVVDLSGGTRTNRAGSVVIQVEALFFPWCRYNGKVYEHLSDTPGKGWDALHAWIKSWGVPDAWPMGKPNGFTGNRDEHTWETKAGWFGHNSVPENSHTDPGAWPAFPAPAKPPTTTSKPAAYQPFPGVSWFSTGRKSPIVARMHDRLVAVGCNWYTSSANKDTIGNGDKASYEAWQTKLKYTGSAVSWPPGKASWDALKVPKS